MKETLEAVEDHWARVMILGLIRPGRSFFNIRLRRRRLCEAKIIGTSVSGYSMILTSLNSSISLFNTSLGRHI